MANYLNRTLTMTENGPSAARIIYQPDAWHPTDTPIADFASLANDADFVREIDELGGYRAQIAVGAAAAEMTVEPPIRDEHRSDFARIILGHLPTPWYFSESCGDRFVDRATIATNREAWGKLGARPNILKRRRVGQNGEVENYEIRSRSEPWKLPEGDRTVLATDSAGNVIGTILAQQTLTEDAQSIQYDGQSRANAKAAREAAQKRAEREQAARSRAIEERATVAHATGEARRLAKRAVKLYGIELESGERRDLLAQLCATLINS